MKNHSFNTTFLSILFLLLSNPCFASDEEKPLNTKVSLLTSDTAVQIAMNTIHYCRQQGAQISVSVVDRFGIIQAQIRDTLAAPISAPISLRKARAAANFNAVTATLKQLEKSPLANIENLLIVPGGAPVAAGGILYGGVGVSGSTGETDQKCASFGAQSMQEDLEMMADDE